MRVVVPLAKGQALAVGLTSYDGGVFYGLNADRDAMADVVLNQLWRHTPAQGSFPCNMLAIRGGRPETLTLRDIIESFVKFREEVITRRAKFELAKARDRAHILLGLVIAVTNLDEVVKLIRSSALVRTGAPFSSLLLKYSPLNPSAGTGATSSPVSVEPSA